jgi:hypothetical protein
VHFVPAGLQDLDVWCGKQFTGGGLAHLTRLTALGALRVRSFEESSDDEASDSGDDGNWHDVRLTRDEVRAAAVIVRHSTVSKSRLHAQSKQSTCDCCCEC